MLRLAAAALLIMGVAWGAHEFAKRDNRHYWPVEASISRIVRSCTFIADEPDGYGPMVAGESCDAELELLTPLRGNRPGNIAAEASVTVEYKDPVSGIDTTGVVTVPKSSDEFFTMDRGKAMTVLVDKNQPGHLISAYGR
ncbi:hypothetical protein U1708_08145 [Sphingomonas sp. ZB1N12]|uniref:hypothetical protein n=1 Tax=Sphingomonas arabinosi TaxID=3096160 RepID=UPI002FCABDDD